MRTLAPEALYSSDTYDNYKARNTDYPAQVELMLERLQRIDPDGKKALALIRSIEFETAYLRAKNNR